MFGGGDGRVGDGVGWGVVGRTILDGHDAIEARWCGVDGRWSGYCTRC